MPQTIRIMSSLASENPSQLPHELAFRHELRRLILSRRPARDDPRELAQVSFERAALAVDLTTRSASENLPRETVLHEALHALAEGAAAAAAAVISTAAAPLAHEADVELRWPDQTSRKFPLGGSPLGPSDWLRAIAAALIVRDADQLEILSFPEHLLSIHLPPHLADPFWPPFCGAVAALVRGTPPPLALLREIEPLLAPESVQQAEPAAIQAQIAPLLPLLNAIISKNKTHVQFGLERALLAHRAYFAQDSLANSPFRSVSLEALGFAALASNLGIELNPPLDLSFLLDTARAGAESASTAPRVSVALAFRPRLLQHSEDAIGFLDLRQFPREPRKHVVLSRPGSLVALYDFPGGPGLPRVTAEFALPGSQTEFPLALDPGERLSLARQYAEQASHSEFELWISQAVNAVNAVIDLIPSGTDQIPESVFTSPRGQQEYRLEPGRFSRARLIAYRDGLSRQLRAPSHRLPSIESAPDRGNEAARASAAVSIEIIRARLAPILQQFALDPSGQILAALKPRDEDYAKAFLPNALAVARAYYEPFWSDSPKIRLPAPGETQLHISLAPAGMFLTDNALSRTFPGGYRSAAPFLHPRRVWAAWRYTAAGQTSGMSYDGLVWCDDHWAWFPKPYRPLSPLLGRAG